MSEDLHQIARREAECDLANAAEKEAQLLARLSREGSLMVALSGGTDSAYLAWAGHRALGAGALAVTAVSPSFSAYDEESCRAFVRHTGITHEFIASHELENPLYAANDADRCYHCKSELFDQLEALAAARGFAAVAYGINADDTGDFRPGHRAAKEHRILAPLLDVGLHKAEIRALSRRAGLPTWDRPASACLASRIPYGTPVTAEALARVERAEAVLREMGFRQFRVRYFAERARVEISREELPRAAQPELLAVLRERFATAGFLEMEIDPRGYRQGSLNEALPAAVKKLS
jgi:uncharacterized protein